MAHVPFDISPFVGSSEFHSVDKKSDTDNLTEIDLIRSDAPINEMHRNFQVVT